MRLILVRYLVLQTKSSPQYLRTTLILNIITRRGDTGLNLICETETVSHNACKNTVNEMRVLVERSK